eukprot:283593-Amphidinium_carterae.1
MLVRVPGNNFLQVPAPLCRWSKPGGMQTAPPVRLQIVTLDVRSRFAAEKKRKTIMCWIVGIACSLVGEWEKLDRTALMVPRSFVDEGDLVRTPKDEQTFQQLAAFMCSLQSNAFTPHAGHRGS